MSKKIIQVNEGAIKEELKELVRGSVEETLNDLLEKESQNCRRTWRVSLQGVPSIRCKHPQRLTIISIMPKSFATASWMPIPSKPRLR